MILFPAIDILDGRAVRLYLGKRDAVTDYGVPLEMAQKWQAMGAQYLHLVDLNAAFDGDTVNEKVIKEIAAKVNIPVQVGGGMRSEETVQRYLGYGVQRVIIGTAMIKQPQMFQSVAQRYGERIVAGIDVKDGYVQIKGWVEGSAVTAAQCALNAKQMGVSTIVYTDVSRDGALCGVDVDGSLALQAQTDMNVIASGGLSNLQQLRALKDGGAYGAILGKALYSGAFTLEEALAI